MVLPNLLFIFWLANFDKECLTFEDYSDNFSYGFLPLILSLILADVWNKAMNVNNANNEHVDIKQVYCLQCSLL